MSCYNIKYPAVFFSFFFLMFFMIQAVRGRCTYVSKVDFRPNQNEQTIVILPTINIKTLLYQQNAFLYMNTEHKGKMNKKIRKQTIEFGRQANGELNQTDCSNCNLMKSSNDIPVYFPFFFNSVASFSFHSLESLFFPFLFVVLLFWRKQWKRYKMLGQVMYSNKTREFGRRLKIAFLSYLYRWFVPFVFFFQIC